MKHQKTLSVCLKNFRSHISKVFEYRNFPKEKCVSLPLPPLLATVFRDSPVDSLFISKMSDYFICDGNFNNLPLHFHSLYAVISLLKVLL